MRPVTSSQHVRNQIAFHVNTDPATQDQSHLFRIGNRKYVSPQMMLCREWVDVEISSYKHGSVIVGDFFEEATSRLLHLGRLSTSGYADLCPDLGAVGKMVVESKACNMVTGRCYLLWEYQLMNYEEINSQNTPVLFVLWTYEFPDRKIRLKDFKWRESLRKSLSITIVSLTIVTLADILALIRGKRFEDGGGYCASEGMKFCRLRVKEVAEYTKAYNETLVRGLVVYDYHCCNFVVRTNQQ